MNKYTALRALSWIYIIIAGLIFVGAILLGGLTIATPSVEYNIYSGELERGAPLVELGVSMILSGTVVSITLAAFGQLLQVIIEMLENSREQTKLLRVMARKSMTK